MMPDLVFYDDRVRHLSSMAFRLLCELQQQYNSFNNGNLSATPRTLAHDFSASTLKRAKAELLQADLIEVTRLGSGRQPTLYALTFYPINEIEKHGIRQTQKASRRANGKRQHFYPVRKDIAKEIMKALHNAAQDKQRREANHLDALNRANAAIEEKKYGPDLAQQHD